jgi:hypothetical protein
VLDISQGCAGHPYDAQRGKQENNNLIWGDHPGSLSRINSRSAA